MIHPSKLLLLGALALLCGCPKKSEAEKSSARGGAATTATATGSAARWTFGDVVRAERVPFAKLQTLFPESLDGLKRGPLRGRRAVSEGGFNFTEASADFDGAAHLTLLIKDSSQEAGDLVSAWDSNKLGEHLVITETSDSSAMTVVVVQRFVVEASMESRGQPLKPRQLRAALEKLDLGKLAGWRYDGVK